MFTASAYNVNGVYFDTNCRKSLHSPRRVLYVLILSFLVYVFFLRSSSLSQFCCWRCFCRIVSFSRSISVCVCVLSMLCVIGDAFAFAIAFARFILFTLFFYEYVCFVFVVAWQMLWHQFLRESFGDDTHAERAREREWKEKENESKKSGKKHEKKHTERIM